MTTRTINDGKKNSSSFFAANVCRRNKKRREEKNAGGNFVNRPCWSNDWDNEVVVYLLAVGFA